MLTRRTQLPMQKYFIFFKKVLLTGLDVLYNVSKEKKQKGDSP